MAAVTIIVDRLIPMISHTLLSRNKIECRGLLAHASYEGLLRSFCSVYGPYNAVIYKYTFIVLNNKTLRILQHQSYRAHVAELYKNYNTLDIPGLHTEKFFIHQNTR